MKTILEFIRKLLPVGKTHMKALQWLIILLPGGIPLYAFMRWIAQYYKKNASSKQEKKRLGISKFFGG